MLDQAKAAGELSLLQPYLQVMVKAGGFAVSRLGTRVFNALYPKLGGLKASSLPDGRYISAGQPCLGRRITELSRPITKELKSLVHQFVLSGKG
jgi:hypothetical protein